MFLVIAVNSYAVSDDFSGFSVGLDTGLSIQESAAEANYRYINLFAAAQDQFIEGFQRTDDDHGLTFTSNLNVDYNQPLDKKWYLGVGGSLFFEQEKHLESQAYFMANPNNRVDFPIDYKVKTDIDPRDHFSIGFKPGYALTDNLLAYVSLSYHRMDAYVLNRQLLGLSSLNQQTTVLKDAGQSQLFEGWGVGGGFKYRIFKRWFLNVSAEWVRFNEESILGPNLRSVADEATITQYIDVRPSWVDIRCGLSYKF